MAGSPRKRKKLEAQGLVRAKCQGIRKDGSRCNAALPKGLLNYCHWCSDTTAHDLAQAWKNGLNTGTYTPRTLTIEIADLDKPLQHYTREERAAIAILLQQQEKEAA